MSLAGTIALRRLSRGFTEFGGKLGYRLVTSRVIKLKILARANSSMESLLLVGPFLELQITVIDGKLPGPSTGCSEDGIGNGGDCGRKSGFTNSRWFSAPRIN